MDMKTYYYTTAFLIIVASFGCRKTTPEIPYYPMNTNFKNNFLQGWQGSYWIYTDSLGTYFDTVTLVLVGKGIGPTITSGSNYTSESYTTHYQATNCVDYFTELMTYSVDKGSDKVAYSFTFGHNSGQDFYITLRDGIYSPANILQTLDSITILGKSYYNVIRLRGGSEYFEVIIDPKIGIVYKEAWSKRPYMGVKNFYLKEFKLN